MEDGAAAAKRGARALARTCGSLAAWQRAVATSARAAGGSRNAPQPAARKSAGRRGISGVALLLYLCCAWTL